jgi:nucleotide-binding universal stress UspA family protein
MKTILAALNLEGGSDAVLVHAAQLAGEHAAWLVLHVTETESLSHVAGVTGRVESDLQDQARPQAVTRLEEYLVESGRTRRTDLRVEFGSPHEVITRVAGERSADLVVSGDTGRTVPGISRPVSTGRRLPSSRGGAPLYPPATMLRWKRPPIPPSFKLISRAHRSVEPAIVMQIKTEHSLSTHQRATSVSAFGRANRRPTKDGPVGDRAFGTWRRQV